MEENKSNGTKFGIHHGAFGSLIPEGTLVQIINKKGSSNNVGFIVDEDKKTIMELSGQKMGTHYTPIDNGTYKGLIKELKKIGLPGEKYNKAIKHYQIFVGYED